MNRKLNGIPQIETTEVGDPDIRSLSESVSKACDRWLARHGLSIAQGAWGPARKKGERKPDGDLENKTAELPPLSAPCHSSASQSYYSPALKSNGVPACCTPRSNTPPC